MKNLFNILLLFAAFDIYAQAPSAAPDIKYRRSSLYTLIVEDTNTIHADVIKKSFLEYPIPDKFNDHNLKNRTIKTKAVAVDQQITVANYLDNNDIAKKLVAKWFDRNENGAFSIDTVAARGSYNASQMDVSIAMLNKRGKAMLADAGEELIKNTFVLISDFKYIPDSLIVDKAKKTTKIVNDASRVSGIKLRGVGINLPGGSPENLIDAFDKYSSGYVVKTTSYLFRLTWNDSIADTFYNDYWFDKTSVNGEKKAAFDSTKLFKLQFIGKEDAWATVQSFKQMNKPEDVLIAKATVNALDAVIAKLQRTHEEFRTKTKLFTEPLSAKIGLKEGLEANDHYDVLEQRQDEDGKTSYKSIGTISVDGKQIWDNRYMAELDTAKAIDRTLFKGGSKKMYEGLLIKQK